jgi:hypothetical protein
MVSTRSSTHKRARSHPASVCQPRQRGDLVKTAYLPACIAVTAVVLAGCSVSGSGGGGAKSTSSFVTSVNQDAQATASDTLGLITESIAEQSGDVSDSDGSGLVQIYTDAKTLKSHLDDFHSELLTAANANSDSEIDMYQAEKDIRSGVEKIEAWASAGDPTADTWAVPMSSAVDEWNSAVTTVWASTTKPVPTIKFSK